MSIFESKINKLAAKKQRIISKRDNAERAMRERNSRRENKIQVLTNKSVKDYEDTTRVMTQYDRKLDKIVREMESEKIYVEEVAQMEISEYLRDNKTKLKTKLNKKETN